ncbi:MAG TPA: ABC-2 family transporter protein [Symbiobacteriaceae bacterium]|nr:ABC-2 family transporter protein [Symbiobacteriaceae bacterium]
MTFAQFRAFVAITIKEQLAFNGYFWSDLLGQLVLMVIAVFFWRAVYGAGAPLGGMTREQAVAYVLVANSVGMVISWSLIPEFGRLLRSGAIVTELLRPVDFQLRMFAMMLAKLGATMLIHMALLGTVACLFLGLRLPADPRVWFWFALSLVAGNCVLFLFDWIISLSAFYTNEIRGLFILRDGLASFFSGFLVPLALLPDWLRSVAEVLPFGLALNAPVQILTGMTPVSAAPWIIAIQLVWGAGLLLLSRLAFRVAVRTITVQGG